VDNSSFKSEGMSTWSSFCHQVLEFTHTLVSEYLATQMEASLDSFRAAKSRKKTYLEPRRSLHIFPNRTSMEQSHTTRMMMVTKLGLSEASRYSHRECGIPMALSFTAMDGCMARYVRLLAGFIHTTALSIPSHSIFTLSNSPLHITMQDNGPNLNYGTLSSLCKTKLFSFLNALLWSTFVSQEICY